MSSIELNDVPSGYNLAKINENFQEIERVLNEEVLHRVNDGTLPNTLETDIDANSQHIYNLPKPATGGEPLRLKDLFGSPEELLQGPEIEHIVAIEGQTVFNLATAYVPDSDSMYVFRNGVLLQKTVDYVETGTQQVTLTEPANVDDVLSFVPVAVGGAGGGGSDPATGANVGTGVGVFKNALSSQLNFKSLVAGNNITISGFTDTVRIDGVAANTTASNVGAGAGVYKQKTGDNLELKTIVAGSNVTVTPGSDTITIAASLPAGTGEANTASNVGTGSGVFKDKSGVDLRFKTLKAGTNVTLTPTADEITISSAGGGGGSWPIINVMDYGADPTGLTSSLTAFNNAATAASGGLVYVPAGTYAIGSATNSASWWLAPNATISGLANTYSGQNDTSRLTGQVFNMESNKATPRLSGLRVGSSKHWLENDYWKYADGLATIAGVSDFSGIGIAGVSRTSDDPNPTMGSIGVGGFSVNDQTVNPEPAWAMYLNHQRMANTGPSFGMEIDNVNFGNTYSLTPYSNITAFGSVNAPSVNVWLSAGGGTDAIKGIGNTVSAAITLLPNPSSFYRGMVVRAGAIDPATNEVIASYNGGRLAWYDAQGGVERLSGYVTSGGGISGLEFGIRNQNTQTMTEGMWLDGSVIALRPTNQSTLDLGTSSHKWKNVWFTSLRGTTQGSVNYSFEESFSGTFGYYYAFRKDANNTWLNMYPDGTVAISGNTSTGNKLIVWPDGSIFAGHSTPTSAGFCVPDGGKFWLNGSKTSYIYQNGSSIQLVKNGSVVATW